jgi:hypothetical protein
MPVGAEERDDEDDGGDDEQSGDLAAEHGYRVQPAWLECGWLRA